MAESAVFGKGIKGRCQSDWRHGLVRGVFGLGCIAGRKGLPRIYSDRAKAVTRCTAVQSDRDPLTLHRAHDLCFPSWWKHLIILEPTAICT